MMRALPDPIPTTLDDQTFSRELEAQLPAMRGYVMSILFDRDAVEDVIQETSVFLWEQRAAFEVGTNFKAWAFKSAYFKALAHRAVQQRNRIVTFSDDVLHRIAGAADTQADQIDIRMSAMSECLRDLRKQDLQLLRASYVEGRSLTEQARIRNVSPNRLQKAISRIRLGLRQCIETRLTQHP